MKKNILVRLFGLLTRAIVLIQLIMLIVCLVLSCKNSLPTRPKDNPGQWETPRMNREAEEAALWLSDSLIAPEGLYFKILHHLERIRAEYSDSIPQVDINFWPPWMTNKLILMITEEAKDQIRTGQYHDLDSLNNVFHFVSMDTSLFRWISIVVLSFEGRFHPERLAEVYEKISSVIYGEPNSFLGDWSNVYPWYSDNGLTYLFREAWGDCLSGCIYSRYWYFEVTNLGVRYIGTWYPGAEPKPDWWEQAKQGMIHF
ncbi:MAG: hypothetical protein MUO78_06970 [candidate division Zixibacteria bacterium]|nr:hypothetical protein [candidate division Zixibacteria bacterium]